MKPSPSNDLNLMSNVALTDRMEQVDVGSLWVGIGDDEPDFMSMDTLEQTCLLCLLASLQERTLPEARIETEALLGGRVEIAGLVVRESSADWGLNDDTRYETVAPQASSFSREADENHETKEDLESSPLRILEGSRTLNYTLIAAASGTAAGTALVLVEIFFKSQTALFVGLSLFILGSLAWLAAFSWMAVVVIRVTKRHGWCWLKHSSHRSINPATEPPENSP